MFNIIIIIIIIFFFCGVKGTYGMQKGNSIKGFIYVSITAQEK